jgi:hypothetical protein
MKKQARFCRASVWLSGLEPSVDTPYPAVFFVAMSGLELPITALTHPVAKFYRHCDGSLVGDQKGMRCGEISPMPRLPPQL